MHTPKFEHISFDIGNLHEYEDFIEYSNDSRFIVIETKKNTFKLDLEKGTYINDEKFTKAFSFNINFELDDFKGIQKITIPEFLRQKVTKAIVDSRALAIKNSREQVKGYTYNVIENNYEYN